MFSPEQLNHFIANYGVLAVAIIVGLESMGLPLPGETALILASLYAGSHGGNVWLVIISAAAGAIIGDNFGYLIGRELGSRALQKYGSTIGVTPARIRLGQYLFRHHGAKVVFFGRFVALLRVLAAFLAGANRMPWGKFLVANAAGAILWATVVGGFAYFFGNKLHDVHGPFGIVMAVIAVGVLIAITLYLRRNEARMQAAADAEIPAQKT